MTTRREALVMLGAAPLYVAGTASSLAGSSDGPAYRDANFVPDRELHLTVGDNLQQQTWFYAGQRYIVEGAAIVVDENERLRLVIANDTKRSQFLSLDGTPIPLAPSQSRILHLTVDQLHAMTLSNPLVGITRIIQVRPCYQTHAVFAA